MKKWFSGSILRHKNAIDVFIVIERVQYFDETRVKLKANWMIQGTTWYWPCTNVTKIDITRSEWDNWIRYIPKGEFYYA